MPSTIVLNQNNIVPDGLNSSLVYRFPNSVSFPHHEMAIQSVALYYSWENINALPLANNTFSMTWVGPGNVPDPETFIIPDGLYEVLDLNRFLQFQCIKFGWYLINASGRNVYYAEFILNPSLYAVQINTYPVPYDVADWTLQANGSYLGNVGTPYENWTTPLQDPTATSSTSSWPGFAGVSFNPSLTIPNNLNKIFGFSTPNPFVTGLNQGATSGQTQSFLSDVAPQVQPNSSAYLSISNINNKYAIPSSIIYSLSPSVAFGAQIIEQPPQFAWNPLLSGTYNEIRLQILGINFQPLTILDPNMTIVLVIRDTKDTGIQDIISRTTGGKY